MKIQKIIPLSFVCALLLMPYTSSGKINRFVDFYNKYQGKNNVVSLNLPPVVLQSFTNKDDKELAQFLQNISDLKVLVFNSRADPLQYFSDELEENVLSGSFDDLLAVKNGADNIDFKVHMKGKNINEFVMVVSDPGSLVVLYIQGDIDLNQVKKLSKSISVKGMEDLNKLP